MSGSIFMKEKVSDLECHGEPLAVLLYLYSCQYSTMNGLYPLFIPAMAHELGCTDEEAGFGMSSLISAGLVKFDADANIVWVIDMAGEQGLVNWNEKSSWVQLKDNDNRIAGNQKVYDLIQENEFLGEFFDMYSVLFRMKNKRNPLKKNTKKKRELRRKTGRVSEESPKSLRRVSEESPKKGEGKGEVKGEVKDFVGLRPLSDKLTSDVCVFSENSESKTIGEEVLQTDLGFVSVDSASLKSGESKTRPTDRSSLIKEQIDEVLIYYVSKFPGRKRQMKSKKSRDKIRDRLKEKFTTEELKSAIDGNLKSEYHNVQNKYNSIDLIFRDMEHVQMFLEIETSQQPEQWTDERGNPMPIPGYMKRAN